MSFSGTVDFGGGPLISVGTSDLAIAKLDATGTFLWSESFGAPGSTVGAVAALSGTTTGGLAMSARLNGAVNFGCGPVASSANGTTLFASFDKTGTVMFSEVVRLAPGATGPVVDGLGGISYAAVVTQGGGVTEACNAPEAAIATRFAP
jgi:hypothetical protein